MTFKKEEYHPEIGIIFDRLNDDVDELSEFGDRHPEHKAEVDKMSRRIMGDLSALYNKLKEL